MPQYLLSVWHDDDYEVDFSSDDSQRIVAQVGAFNEALAGSGAFVFAAGLQPARTAVVASSTSGGVSMTDGPFAEAKEQIGGFWVIDVADEASARRWLERAAAACEGSVELRPMEGA